MHVFVGVLLYLFIHGAVQMVCCVFVSFYVVHTVYELFAWLCFGLNMDLQIDYHQCVFISFSNSFHSRLLHVFLYVCLCMVLSYDFVQDLIMQMLCNACFYDWFYNWCYFIRLVVCVFFAQLCYKPFYTFYESFRRSELSTFCDACGSAFAFNTSSCKLFMQFTPYSMHIFGYIGSKCLINVSAVHSLLHYSAHVLSHALVQIIQYDLIQQTCSTTTCFESSENL